MTSYDRDDTFGLYLAVLKKTEPSPLLPESDEDQRRRQRSALNSRWTGRRSPSAQGAAPALRKRHLNRRR